MAQEDKNQQAENTEIEPLSEESLEDVAGGAASNSCSWSICSSSQA